MGYNLLKIIKKSCYKLYNKKSPCTVSILCLLKEAQNRMAKQRVPKFLYYSEKTFSQIFKTSFKNCYIILLYKNFKYSLV